MRGKPQRRRLATALQVEATALNLTHVLRMNLVGVTSEGTRKLDAISGAEMALKSHFCLCPSGDSALRPPRTPALHTPAEWSLHAHNYAPPHALPSELSS